MARTSKPSEAVIKYFPLGLKSRDTMRLLWPLRVHDNHSWVNGIWAGFFILFVTGFTFLLELLFSETALAVCLSLSFSKKK